MNVLIADSMEKAGVAALQAAGLTVALEPALTPDDLPARLAAIDPGILIVRSTKVSRAALQAGRSLALVIRAGAGTDTIDVAAASELAIFVANCPGKNSAAVAELAWALLLACDRRIPDATADLRAGRWRKKEYSKARGLAGRTLGVVGTGSIGREVIARARGFGMPVVAWSRSLDDATAAALGVRRAASAVDVARASDAVTLHVAATPDTRHLADAAFFDAMRPGAYFINTTRGSVVDEAALAAAIASKGLRAGLDVFADEPGGGEAEYSNALLALPGVYATPHVGASTDQAQAAIADEAVRIAVAFAATGAVHNGVNRCARSSATTQLVIRHRNRPGVLACVLEALSRAGHNVEEMDNVLYDGAHAACAHIRVDGDVAPGLAGEIEGRNEHIFSIALAAVE